MVHGFRFGDDVARLRFGDLAGIGKLSQVAALRVEIADGFFAADEHDDAFATLVGLADVHHLDARRFRGQGLVVFENIGVIGELLGRADVIAEDVVRRRHSARFRQVVNQRTDELRTSGPFMHGFGKVIVHLLSGRDRDMASSNGQREARGPMITALRALVWTAAICSAQDSVRSLAAKIDEQAAKEQIKLGLDSRLRAAERISVLDPTAARQLLDHALPSIIALGGENYFTYRWMITYARIDIDAAERAAGAVPTHEWTYTGLIDQSWHLPDHERTMRLMRAARHEGYYSLGASFEAATGMPEPYRTQALREFLDEFPIATAGPGDVMQLLRLSNAHPPGNFIIPALKKMLQALDRADFEKPEPGWDFIGAYEFAGRRFHTTTRREALLLQCAALLARYDPDVLTGRAAIMPEWWPLIATISEQERASILRTEPMKTQRPPPRIPLEPLPDVSKLSYDEVVAVAVAMPGASGFQLLISLRSRGLSEEQRLTEFSRQS